MKLSEQAKAHILDREEEEKINAYRREANDRKRRLYWVGFLEGVLSSHRIENGEVTALIHEAKKFQKFFEDPDASDLVDDLEARCFSSERDLIESIDLATSELHSELVEEAEFTESDEFNEFLGFCAGIICDGIILKREADAIIQKFHRSKRLMGSAIFSDLREVVEVSLEDHVLTEDESEEIREWISRLVGDGFIDTGVENIGNVSSVDEPINNPDEITFQNKQFVLTGPMKIGPRSYISNLIADAGGINHPRVTKKADYLAVSSEASKQWRTTHFGTKIERGKELIQEGNQLRFVTETALAAALKRATK